MATATVNGAEIAYDDTGGDGPAVILAHGFLMDRSMFDPQVEALRSDYRMITWDERGFGDTQYDGEPFSYWDSANDCLGLLDHLGIDRAVVGGMSQGGFISLRVALTAPERVRGLILLDTQAGVEDPEVDPALPGDDRRVGGRRPHRRAGRHHRRPHRRRRPSCRPTWIAKWKARQKETLAPAGGDADRARRHRGPDRGDPGAGARGARHRRRCHLGRLTPAPRRRPSERRACCWWRAAPTPPTSPTPPRSTPPSRRSSPTSRDLSGQRRSARSRE